MNLSEKVLKSFLISDEISSFPQGYLSSHWFRSVVFNAGVVKDNIMVTIAYCWHWLASLFIASVAGQNDV